MEWNLRRDAHYFRSFGKEHLPDTIGMRIPQVGEGLLRAEFDVTKELMAPNGYLHAAAVVGSADTAAVRLYRASSQGRILVHHD